VNWASRPQEGALLRSLTLRSPHRKIFSFLFRNKLIAFLSFPQETIALTFPRPSCRVRQGRPCERRSKRKTLIKVVGSLKAQTKSPHVFFRDKNANQTSTSPPPVVGQKRSAVLFVTASFSLFQVPEVFFARFPPPFRLINALFPSPPLGSSKDFRDRFLSTLCPHQPYCCGLWRQPFSA